MDVVSLAIALKAAGKTAEQVRAALDEYLEENPEALDQAAVEAIVGDALAVMDDELDSVKSAISDLEEGSLSALGATAGQVPVADGLGSWAWGAQADGTQTIQVTGTTPAITAVANTKYVCGECATLDITLPASGCIDVMFESGSTPTVLTVTPPTGVTEIEWADGFDPDNLSANATYWLKVINGKLGVATAWGVQSGGGGEKPWNHTHFEVTDASEQTSALIIPNNNAISEILIKGKALFDSYDGIYFFINNDALLSPNTAISSTSCFFQLYGRRIIGQWIGRGDCSQWSAGSNLLDKNAVATTTDPISNGVGDIKVASRWTNKIFQVGTTLDVYWR